MTRNTISTLFLIRRASHFVPLHSPDSPDSPDSLIFSHPKAGPARRKRRGIYLERLRPEAANARLDNLQQTSNA
jgi:hypothetical protein